MCFKWPTTDWNSMESGLHVWSAWFGCILDLLLSRRYYLHVCEVGDSFSHCTWRYVRISAAVFVICVYMWSCRRGEITGLGWPVMFGLTECLVRMYGGSILESTIFLYSSNVDHVKRKNNPTWTFVCRSYGFRNKRTGLMLCKCSATEPSPNPFILILTLLRVNTILWWHRVFMTLNRDPWSDVKVWLMCYNLIPVKCGMNSMLSNTSATCTAYYIIR